MSRFQVASVPMDSSWGTYRPEDDSRVLPPLSTPAAASRRATVPSQHGGTFAFSNTFESSRPSSASSSLSSGGRVEYETVPSTRRSSMHASNRSSIVNSMSVRTPTSPTMVTNMGMLSTDNYQPMSPDPEGSSYTTAHQVQDFSSFSSTDALNVASGSSGQPRTSYAPYLEFDQSAFNNAMQQAAAAQTPQSPVFSYGPPAYPNNSLVYPRTQPPLALAQAVAAASSRPSPIPSHATSPTSHMGTSSMSSPDPRLSIDTSRIPRDQLEEELRQLRTKVQELEFINDLVQLKVVELENDKKALSERDGASKSPSFQASWQSRTNARVKKFCSLNRAGNALCAWHDSRRERRSYPPRMAPPGHLNCGCTYEQALFEESLSRNHVGSYHPGETVRMDPALRNPLLKLLQWRYGYRDGDFERDPVTGLWIEGEGEAVWEAKAAAGPAGNHRRARNEES